MFAALKPLVSDSANMPKRYSGFLTKHDRNSLAHYTTEEADFYSDNERRQRAGIRQRTARALRDMVILNRFLPDTTNDRPAIFEAFTDPELWGEFDPPLEAPRLGDALGEIIEFLVLGYIEHSGEDAPVSKLANWIRDPLRKANPGSYIRVEVECALPDEIDKIHDRYKRDPDDLSNHEFEILLSTNRIDLEDYSEHVEREDWFRTE